MQNYTIRHNALTAEEFISLWESVWGQGPTPEQTRLAMDHTLFRVSMYDGDKVIAMARMMRSQGNWRWEGPLGTPLGLVHWKRASSPVEAGTSGFL